MTKTTVLKVALKDHSYIFWSVCGKWCKFHFTVYGCKDVSFSFKKGDIYSTLYCFNPAMKKGLNFFISHQIKWRGNI